MEFTFDVSDLDRLAIDLGNAGPKATREAMDVIKKAAVEIKKGMAEDFTGHSHAPLIPRAVDFTVRGLSAEIGVNKSGPQGGLGNILAFGTSKNAAVVDHTAALRRELPNVERFLGDIGEQVL